MISELQARYDARKSFYGKAQVETLNGKVNLYSYNTLVATVCDGVLSLTSDWNYSLTTRRHVNEFVKQMGVEEQFADIKKRW